ncbi:MAG: Lin0512 family protein [Gudongella sp.]|nr:Lin0512 family protein [Gudongella sp.]
MKRYIIEFGMGVDFHGQDVTRAAEKAVLDAVSKSCLCGLEEVLEIKNLNDAVAINVTLAVTRPEEVDEDRVKACLPIGKKRITVKEGGLKIPGLFIPDFGDKNDSIEAAIACVEVEII